MANIPPTSNSLPSLPPASPQLAGINASVPAPTAPTPLNGSGFSLNEVLVAGGSILGGTGDAAVANTSGNAAITGAGAIGAAPAAGAQPAAPNSAAVAATGSTVAGTTASTTAGTTAAATTLEASSTSSVAAAVSGFGRADKDAPIKASIGSATFEFPTFNSTKGKNEAPDITWGDGWTKVQKDGLYYMQHTNGTKAVPAIEFRMTPSPAGKVRTIHVANGWGKKFPDGTVLVFDKQQGVYRLDAKGGKHPVGLGTHKFGGVKVRVFEASVVRTLEPNGMVNVFDSRGNQTLGTTRGHLAGAVAGSGAGAALVSGSGPSKTDGGGKTTGGGSVDNAKLTTSVQAMTAMARELLAQIQSGSMDSTKLAQLQSQLSGLPESIRQAVGASSVAGTSTPPTGAPGDAPTPPAAGTSTTDSGSLVAGVNGGGTTPIAGNDTDAGKIKDLPAGSSATTKGELGFQGERMRFGQLPPLAQREIAEAFGSDQADAAFSADQMISFGADKKVSLVEAGRVYLRKVSTIRGAGPGEDLAMTMRPNRQPGETRPTAAGSTISATRKVVGGGTSASGPSSAASGMSATRSGRGLPVFATGTSISSPGLAGLEGSFTWKSLPATARTAITRWITEHPASAAAKGMSMARTMHGMRMAFDPSARIVLANGSASFVDGLALIGSSAPALPKTRTSSKAHASSASHVHSESTAGGGLGRASGAAPGTTHTTHTTHTASPTTQPIGHNATTPPVSGGGGVTPTGTAPTPPTGGATPPGGVPTAPPAGTGTGGMPGMPGMPGM